MLYHILAILITSIYSHENNRNINNCENFLNSDDWAIEKDYPLFALLCEYNNHTIYGFMDNGFAVIRASDIRIIDYIGEFQFDEIKGKWLGLENLNFNTFKAGEK